MKKKILKIIDTYVLWTAAIISIPVLLYGAWFQTEGLTLEAVTVREMGASVVVGAGLGLILMVLIYRQTKKERPQGGKKASRSDLSGMMIGNLVCFIFFIVMVYTATNVAFFKFGLGGIAYAAASFFFYLIWGIIEKKKSEKAVKEAA
ncbi:MAG: hypothetical protein IKR59_04385 [Lachnospiraceae bacterium]|nr:hypothetical protein [Lachnospiraceae bacterium]